MHDIIIIGAGPAGMTAAIYALRFGKSVLVLEKETFGGQITYSPKVENYPGYKEMTGNEFADKLMDQVLSLGGEIEMETVESVTSKDGFSIKCSSGNEYLSRAVIIAVGSKHRQLGLRNETGFIGNGISYCAVCDGAFYKNRSVAVIGGGNTALQEAVMLSDICSHVTIVQNLPTLTGEKKLAEILESRENVSIIYNCVVTGLDGDSSLTGITITDNDKNSSKLDVDGIFVAIGQSPENEPFTNLCLLNSYGYIEADENCMLPTDGVFVAGDCRSKTVRQVATAVGDGAVAAVNACKYLDAHI